ncbi:MAG: C25 family cysteine peptidase [candidate division WOR-3 bacterium]
MRQIIVFFTFVSMNIFWAGEIIQNVEFLPDDLVITRIQDYDVIELKGCIAIANQPGEPRLPKLIQAVLIPAGAVPASVEIVSEEVIELKGNYKIYPYQPDVPLPMPNKVFIPKFFEPKKEIYNSNRIYPNAKLKLIGVGSLCGYQIAHIEINPVEYIPLDGRLRLLTRLTYRLKYFENRVDNTVPTAEQQRIFGEDVRTFVANPEMVDIFAPHVNGKSPSRILPSGDYKYVIISGAIAFDTIFQRLADWKTKKGIPTKVVQISWIGNTYSGYDLPEKLRNFIIDAKNTWGTIWVLLGGSADHKTSGQNLVPERSCWYTTSYAWCYYDEDSIPCDLYFAGLSGSWDANGNHTYGEITDNADMYSDVYVGRASVYTISQVQNFVYKILTYEKNPPTSYLTKMLLPTAILWPSYDERPMQDSIARITTTPPWFDAKLYERNGTLSRQRMIDSMNVGYGMGAWEGHGNENGIYMHQGGIFPPYLTSSDADGLTNGNKQGIAISIACFTGAWDETPGGDCFAEHLINRTGGGLLGVMFNSRYGWGAIVNGQYVPGPSERLDTTYFAKIFQGGLYKMGQVLAAAKDAWVPYADWGNQYTFTRWCLYELNLLGDPELPLWTKVPANLSVSYPAVLQVGNQNVNVIVMHNGTPISNALVCLQKGNETYAYGYTNTSGTVTLNVAPTSPGTMDITVTAPNYYPFEGTIQVLMSNYAMVMYLKNTISDPIPGGNNDGILNPGESVELPLWVKNFGNAQASNVIGILRETESYVSISDTIKSFGNIVPGDSAYTGSNGYDLQVANNCPNGYNINLTLVCKDNLDSTWTSQFSLMVYAPVIVYQSVAVVGGNNNGRLDPGETANLILTIKNEGSATANNVIGVLTETSPYVTINDADGSFGNVPPMATANNNSDPFTVTVASNAPQGTMINFQVLITSGVYSTTINFSLMLGRKHYYLWNPEPTPSPGQNMHSILTSLGYIGDYGTTLTGDLTLYQSVFVCLGVWPNNYIIYNGTTEATQLYNYLLFQNGKVYLEGGDVWYYDPMIGGYNFCSLFGINATADGIDDMGPVAGQWGTFTAGMVFNYSGENNLMDHISPSGGGAFLIFRDQDNNYDCGVANYGFGNSRTVGTSFELGLLTDGSGVSRRAILLDSIMHFFGCIQQVGIEENEQALTFGQLGISLMPNPSRNRLTIKFEIPNSKSEINSNLATRYSLLATLHIYDATGRVVRQWDHETIRQSDQIIWDGTDNFGRRLPAGIYFIQLQTENFTQVEKALLLK